MDIASSSSIDNLFAANIYQTDGLSNSSLSRGIDAFINGDYDKAVREFKKTTALSPYSNNSYYAFTYMADAYLKQQKADDAVRTYQDAIKFFPNNEDLRIKLGDVYFVQDRFNEAEKEYTKAISINPNSPLARYSLGQVYLETGQSDAAENQFKEMIRISPKDPSGYFGLGQVARQLGRNTEAIEQFERALSMNSNFPEAYLNLGYTYADMGDTDKAQEQLDTLIYIKSPLSINLINYMSETKEPKILFASSTTGFSSTSGPGTDVSALASSLTDPDSTKRFSMNFIFSKEMNSISVENIANWRISRQTGGMISNRYNFGMPLPETEITLPSIPENVIYDSKNMTAVVTFRLTQNSAGDGTIDPSHVLFKFSGIDAYGRAMDPAADEYSGFSEVI